MFYSFWLQFLYRSSFSVDWCYWGRTCWLCSTNDVFRMEKERMISLDEMEVLEKACTKGPWYIQKIDSDAGYSSFQAYNCKSENGPSTCELASDYSQAKKDIEFTIGARDFVPWAIARIRELELPDQREMELLRKIEKLIIRNAKLEPVVSTAMNMWDQDRVSSALALALEELEKE